MPSGAIGHQVAATVADKYDIIGRAQDPENPWTHKFNDIDTEMRILKVGIDHEDVESVGEQLANIEHYVHFWGRAVRGEDG